MAICWTGLILLLSIFSIHANAISNYTLSTELTSFIPTCAQECFISFLDSNFPTTTCSTTPMLDCLCSHNSTSGYTIGEGAVQCIISEINIGFCKGNSAKDSVVSAAYSMCNGQPSALPNTHATITATLVVQTSMPSIVLVAPGTTSLASSSNTRASSTTSSLRSSTSAGSISASLTASSTPGPSITGSSTVSSIPAASETASPQPVLTKPQIVGITVASIGGGTVAIGLIILFICCRRKRKRSKRDSDSDLIPFQLEADHVMDHKKYKYKSFKGPTERRPGGTANGVAAKLPPRIPIRLDTSSPNMFSRRSIRPDTIGLAISPEQNVSVEKQQRRSSKLLPEKPTLTLKVPQQAEKQIGTYQSNQTIQPTALSRQSTATQFEEDYDDSADTAVAPEDSWTRKSTDQTLDAATGNWRTVRGVTQQPASNTGDDYHWRPGQSGNTSVSRPDYYIRPLSVTRRVGSFSQPRVPNAYGRQDQQQQLVIPEITRPTTTSSSIYSARGSLSSNDPGARNSAPRNRLSYQKSGPYDTQETIISPQERDPEPRTAGADLSPVVESPASGRSPVSYPKIPQPSGRVNESIRMVSPPAQPDFTQALGAGKPWRQAEIAAQLERERTARQAQSQVQEQFGMQGLRTQGHQRQRSREVVADSASSVAYAFPAPPPLALVPGRSHTAPPEKMPSPYLFRSPSQSALSPPGLLRSRSQLQRDARTPPPQQYQPQGRNQQPQLQTVVESPPRVLGSPLILRSRSQRQRDARAPSPAHPQKGMEAPLPSPKPPLPLRSRSQLQQARNPPPLQTQLTPQQQSYQQPQYTTQPAAPSSTTLHPRPNINPNPLQSHPSITFTRSSSLISQTSQGTQNSSTSSLLAKRRGESKASTLTLKNEEDRVKQIAKWRVLKRDEIELAKKEGWRPMVGREGERERDGEGGGNEFERTELPQTPGWMPRLTPTRRGDELFLSVQ